MIRKCLKALGLMVLSLAMGGCASWNQGAYRTVGTTAVTADGAMKAWATWVNDGNATSDQIAVVEDAWNKYYAAMQVAHSAENAYNAAGASDNSQLVAALDAMTAASGNLIALIEQFVPASKLQQLKAGK